jgi:hypothetical protein
MPRPQPQMTASGNINPCRFVKISGSNTVAECDANEMAIGISGDGTNFPPITDTGITVSGYHASAGQTVDIKGDGDICLLEVGEVVAAGARLKSDADGKGVAIATSGTTVQQFGAVALQASAAAGEKILVQVTTYRSERPDADAPTTTTTAAPTTTTSGN